MFGPLLARNRLPGFGPGARVSFQNEINFGDMMPPSLGQMAFVFFVATTQLALAATPAEVRRDKLARIQEVLADPDPLVRLTEMEAVVESGDATEIQVALRTAFSSDDANLRAIGMRAYIASVKEINLDIELPTEMQKQYNAVVNDPEKLQALASKNQTIKVLSQIGFRIRIGFKNYEMSSITGIVVSRIERNFAISGDRLSGAVLISNGTGYCNFDLRPTRTLTLEGTLTCNELPRLVLKAPIF